MGVALPVRATVVTDDFAALEDVSSDDQDPSEYSPAHSTASSDVDSDQAEENNKEIDGRGVDKAAMAALATASAAEPPPIEEKGPPNKHNWQQPMSLFCYKEGMQRRMPDAKVCLGLTQPVPVDTDAVAYFLPSTNGTINGEQPAWYSHNEEPTKDLATGNCLH